MDFSDKAILRLATPAGRNSLLDQTTLAQMAEAGFDTAAHPLTGPFALEVDTVDLGAEIARAATLEGQIVSVPGSPPMDVRLKLAGFPAAAPLRIDALWRGALIARRVPQDDRVEAVSGGFSALDIDREIIADLGALPRSSSALEAERRRRLAARLGEGAANPDLIDSGSLDAMLGAANAADVATLIEARGTAGLARFLLQFGAAAATPPVPVRLPSTIAVIVRDAPLRLASLLAETRTVLSALSDTPALQPNVSEIRRRSSVLVLWVVPQEVLDDDGWPGADRSARRTAAAELLSPQGIALAPA